MSEYAEIIPSYQVNKDFGLIDAVDKIALAISKAKALTAVGATAELDTYQPNILNHYFDSIMTILSEADHVCDFLIKNRKQWLKTY